MKIRVGWVLLAIAGVVWLSGCQSSAGKTDEPTAVEAKPAARSTASIQTEEVEKQVVHTRDPKTGRMVLTSESVTTKTQKPDATAPADAEKPRTRTVRTRNPETGEIITKEVPVTTTPASRAATTTRTVRTRDPNTGRLVTKEVPVTTSASPKPASGPFEITWSETCSVEQAFNATNRLLYETLGLKKVHRGGGYCYEPESDYTSATLKAYSTIGIKFDVYIVLESDGMVIMKIKPEDSKQPREILEKHLMLIKHKITEAISKEPQTAHKAVPYAKSMVFDGTVEQICKAIFQWTQTTGLDINKYENDQFSGLMTCDTKSGMRLVLRISLVGTDRTQVEVVPDNYEGDELPMILRSLTEILSNLKQPAEAVDEAAAARQMQFRFEQPELSDEKKAAILAENISSIQEIMKQPDKKDEREVWEKLLKALQDEQKSL